jgi:hypothetical protein
MSGFQLTPPFSTWRTGFQPASPLLPVPQLTLTPQYAASLLGWSVLGANRQVYNLMLNLPGRGDDALRPALAMLSQAVTAAPANPQLALPPFLKSLGVDSMDSLYGLAIQLGSSSWTDVPGPKTNVATGQPASIGKVSPSGTMIPTPADGMLAGFAVPLPAISAGKRYPFSSGLDVHLYVYVDKDAFSQDMRLWVPGGGVGFEGKTSSGTSLKLRFGAGRDQAGGGAGFIRLQIGPDFVPMPVP